ncbi:MAG: hypothetical protein QOG60_774, partial [Frankiaceae bacterium]|nr:hypothetical protein [Frankiaceae bacterium]
MSDEPSAEPEQFRRPGLTRRRLLLGSCAAAVLGAGAAIAEPHLRSGVQAVVPPPLRPGGPSTPHAASVLNGSFDSAARKASTGWSIAYPPGAKAGDALPVLLVLHGRSDDYRAALGSHGLGGFLAQAVARGTAPFALVAVDGGDHDYWHPRTTGADAQAMLVDEFLPLLASRGLEIDRFAVGGWSMGGYGALLLAERLGHRRIAAIAMDSPAIWTRASETAPGAFDGRQDFLEHDVLRRISPVRSIPV